MFILIIVILYLLKRLKQYENLLNFTVIVICRKMYIIMDIIYHSVLYQFSGLCLYLDDQSTVDSHECDHFNVGCPDKWHYNYHGFERNYYYFTFTNI